LSPIANHEGETYSLPFNMSTFNKIWGVTTEEQAKEKIASQSNHIDDPKNLEEQAIKLVGKDVYEKLIKGYTEKQWRKPCRELPKEIIKRLTVRFTYENNYFNDKYQGIPIGGYTQLFEKLLKGIDIALGTDYFNAELPEHDKVIYTGPIDRFFDYRFGELEYKTTRFDHTHFKDRSNYQGTAVVNYTSKSVPYTRIIEHKHFEFAETPTTWVTTEYPIPYKADETEPYYPVNDSSNNELYQLYKLESDKLKNIHFGGRLAEYKYYDMDKVIESALNFLKKEILFS
jgi:UDP-galactopyranose mutase